jgi:catecholate siderophore receptor
VVEGSRTRGVEVQLTGDLTERWSISTGYAYLDGEVRFDDNSGNDGNRTRQTPENMFSIWNNLAINQKLRVALGATYQDSFFVREDNRVKVPSYVRVDAAAYYDFTDTVTLQLNIENLLDENYFPDAHSNNNISTGRPLNASLSISASF